MLTDNERGGLDLQAREMGFNSHEELVNFHNQRRRRRPAVRGTAGPGVGANVGAQDTPGLGLFDFLANKLSRASGRPNRERQRTDRR